MTWRTEGAQRRSTEGGIAIAEVGGRISAGGREEIDARGCVVTPGWIDIHTHYDGQVAWDDKLEPSAAHGVTTVVIAVPVMCHDLPGGGSRIMQGAEGYVATLVAGTLTRSRDEDTGARPGRLVRSG